MILHGNRRGGARDLARHLLKDENEHVDVHELRGFISDDLPSALSEAYAISKATRAKKFLYSLSLNPPENEKVPTGAFLKAITQVEKTLNLNGQPRAIVFHEKKGRRHCHVVWSRIDTKTLKAIPLSHDWPKLTAISRRLYIEHGWNMPPGLMDRQNRDPKNFTMAQWQQARRMKTTPRAIRQSLEECWALSHDRQSFTQALNSRGYDLAKGDRAGFVVLDYGCEIFALGTKWMGVKVRDIRARLGSEKHLPTVDQTRAVIAQRMSAVLSRLQKRQSGIIDRRRAELETRRMALVTEQQEQRRRLEETQQTRRSAETRARQARFNKGIKGLWDRLTGKRARIAQQNRRETFAALRRDRAEQDALIFTHLQQRQTLQRRIKRLETFEHKRTTDLTQDLNQYRDIQNRRRELFDLRAARTQSHTRGPTMER